MRIVCISDTHGQHKSIGLPEGDVLVHSGDITMYGEDSITEDFNRWLGEQPFQYKVVIGGNHDFNLEKLSRERGQALLSNAIYLYDSGIEISGWKFWGSPVQPRFHNWAWNRDRGDAIEAHWKLIPDDTDVLLTHGPPQGILDKVTTNSPSLGCWDLMRHVEERISPRLHVFGHIHGGYGQREHAGTTYVNASVLNEAYRRAHAPIVVEL